ncbi:MAG: N-acetylmuramoyl-L-alanine amidase [Thermoanaerobaculia bacterium]|nr:N-acetylmuramoyl-L-alanine amidase [Thermoanaerobaculia bacterium]
MRRRAPDSLHAAEAFRCLTAALVLTAAVARGEDVTAVLSRPDKPAASLRAEERDGRTYLSLNDAVAALDGTMTFDERTRSYEVKLKGRSAVFGVDAALAVVDTKLVPLGAPVRGQGALAWAEPEFFQRVLGPMAGLSLTWDRATRALSVRKGEIAEIAVEPSVADLGEMTKVVFRFSQTPSYAVEATAEQVVLHVPNARLSATSSERLLDSPRVARLLVRGGDLTIVFREKGLLANVYALGAPPRLVVDVTRRTSGAPGARTPGLANGPPPASRAKTVVLDPGHGGVEEGARGPGGLFEKDATLALTKTVQEVLQRRGYRVVVTRSSDATVGLDDRAAAANAAKADVFLSIHCNASRAATAHGTEVYYLSLDASDRAAALLAESENAAPAATPNTADKNAAVRDLDLILWDLAQNQHLSASARLAEIVQADFNRLLGITTRGVKQAPFRVLIGVNAPAVLVEVAFITNPDEEARIGSDEFRRQVADTLAGSVDTYFRTADDVAPVPYAPKPPGKS